MRTLIRAICTAAPVLWWLLLIGIAGGIEQGTIALYTGALWMIIVILAGCLTAALLRDSK